MRVEVIESTPNPDEVACRAARGDYSSEWIGPDRTIEEVMEPVEGDSLEEKKRNLIEKCIRRGHYGIAEHPTFTLAVEGISRACMAQLTRHRHASFDVQSMRYVDMKDPTMYMPPCAQKEETVTREGVSSVNSYWAKGMIESQYSECVRTYRKLVDKGVPKEEARMVLPLGTCVNLTMTGNARMFMHILSLRTKADAQTEIRELSDAVLDVLKNEAPIMFEVFETELPMRIAP